MRSTTMSPYARYRVEDGRMVFAGALEAWPVTITHHRPAGGEQTLLAAASHYRVRWPLPHVLQYAQARMLEPEERGWVVIAAAMAMLNGYLTPKDKTPRRRPA